MQDVVASKPMAEMKRALSTEGGEPIRVFRPTPERMRYRLEWGRRAGRAAFARGDDMNGFRDLPRMPMHRGWIEGYQAAELELRLRCRAVLEQT